MTPSKRSVPLLGKTELGVGGKCIAIFHEQVCSCIDKHLFYIKKINLHFLWSNLLPIKRMAVFFKIFFYN